MPAKFGQNFLVSGNIAQKMARVAEVTSEDTVLEIGPGKGILTTALLKTGAKVIAVEKDFKLFNFLKQKFEPFILSNHLTLISADIRDLLTPQSAKSLALGKITKVVANIPYYLTGRLLRLLLDPEATSRKLRITSLTLMLQKEVAERLAPAKSLALGKNSLLAVSVRVFAEPKIAFYVKKGNFRPQPKVDSAVILLKKREKDFFKKHKISQGDFFDAVKAGFAHPRKLLKNNLKMSNTGCLTRCGVGEKVRAEDLSLENWACVTHFIHREK